MSHHPDGFIANPLDKDGAKDNLITNPLDKPGGGDKLIPNPLDASHTREHAAEPYGEGERRPAER